MFAALAGPTAAYPICILSWSPFLNHETCSSFPPGQDLLLAQKKKRQPDAILQEWLISVSPDAILDVTYYYP